MPTRYYSTSAQNGTTACWLQMYGLFSHLTVWGLRLVDAFPSASGRVVVAINGAVPSGRLACTGMTTSTST